MRSLLLASLIAAAPPAPEPPERGPLATRVEAVLSQTPVIDGHNDLPWEIRERFGGRTIDLAADTRALPAPAGQPPLMTDIPRLRAGNVGAQFWSVYIPATVTGPQAIETTLEQIDVVDRMAARFPQTFARADTADDIMRIEKAGRIAALIGIEGGHQIDGSLAMLRQMYAAGARYMTLTHATNVPWADSATDAPLHHGLTPFGRAVVAEMNRLGMLVDLSHVSPETMKAALAVSTAPVIFSHSSARALVDHPRDVPDDVLALVRANRGVVMVNFYPLFVSDARYRWNADREGAVTRAAKLYPGDPDRAGRAIAAWDHANPRPVVTIAMVADHVEHIARVCGHDCVGIGSDFDGIGDTPQGLEDVSTYPALFLELARRGWSDADMAKLAGLNLLRVLRAAEAVAVRMRGVPPGEATIADLDHPPPPAR